jgi:hypothetical protein
VLQLFKVIKSVKNTKRDYKKVGISYKGKVVATLSGQSWALALFI